MKATEIALGCYPVTDMAHARKFSEDLPGLKLTCTATTLTRAA